MNACIIFDVSGKNEEVRAALTSLGYWSAWVGRGSKYILPHNAMWKLNCELSQAKIDLKTVTLNLSINDPANPVKIKSCIVLPVTPWDGFAENEIVN
jgi:hypothetical protein